jgi:hypothetical protein
MNLTNLGKAVVLATACAALAACSAAPQSPLVPQGTGSQLASLAGPQTSHDAARPLWKLCEPVVYNGTGWQYEPGYMQWWEYDGAWTYSGAPGTPLVPCPGDIVLGKSNTNPYCCWWYQVAVAQWSEKADYYATAGIANTVNIEKITTKTITNVESLDISPYTATSAAVSKTGTLYVGVVPPSGGTQTSCIVYYPPASTTPSGMLSDRELGTQAPAVAVSSADEVFISYSVTSGSSSYVQIDEVPKGKTSAVPFTKVPGTASGSLAVTKSNDLLVGTIVGSSGEIAIVNPKGQITGKLSTTADPAYLSLAASNKTFTISDPTDNLISTYAYPSGSLQSQVSVGKSSQEWVPGEMSPP